MMASRGLILWALLLLASPAMAERPMAVDDAGTLARGGAKLEFGWSRDASARGFDAAAGFAPIDRLELEVGLERSRDRSSDPATRVSGAGFAAKWVPLQSETGLSAGLKFELGHARLERRGAIRESARERSLTALASWAFESGQVAHLNLGRAWSRETGAREQASTWGMGVDHPLRDGLHLTLEVFGARHARPDKQVGLRWTIAQGLKASAALGSGNGRSFGSAGLAWEF